MRVVLLTLSMLVWAVPGLGATTYVVPVTAVPGSVEGTVSSIPLPTSLPFSAPIIDIGDCSETGTFSAEIVNNGLEVELDLTANGAFCRNEQQVGLMLEMIVPELGGTVTMVRLNPVPFVTDFPLLSVPEKYRLHA